MADLEHVSDYSMHFRQERLKSFKDWPFEDANCNAEKLADAGFYHIPSDQSPDATRCFACYKELDGWEPEDDPWSEHKKHSAQCPFLKFGVPVEELSVQELLKLEIKRQTCKINKLFDAKAKELREQSQAVRSEMETFLQS
ncbi:hypothetical protein V1264_011080 [Littorina saxatilis]|uniref:Uncharacterized protein n=3 Tax=Littorina saxatilis TaxID=31220 RepID=A0AAN9GJU1_9CAEN